jgi:hypothetical protein
VCGLLLLLLGVALTGQRAFAHPLAEPAADSLRRTDLVAPDGSRQWLALFRTDAGAELHSDEASVALPVAADHVLAFGLVSPRLLARLDQQPAAQLQLSGPRKDSGFAPDAIDGVDEELAAQTSQHPGLPLYVSLLPRLAISPFGSEERVSLQLDRKGGLKLHCHFGQAPAGILLQGLPDATLHERGAALRLRARGRGEFALLVSDEAALQHEAPLLAGALTASIGWAQLDVALPDSGWDSEHWRALTVACPSGEATLELSDLTLVLADQPPDPGTLALWVWNPLAWQNPDGGLIAHLQVAAARQVFITVPLVNEDCAAIGCAVAQPARLVAFLRQAAQVGIQVWVVAGDPRAVLPGERAQWLARARAYAAFNRLQPADARLAGVQYDIEPYILAGYALAPDDWNRQYLDLLQQLREAGAGLSMDVVLPWWFAQTGQPSAPLLEKLAPLVDRLTIMDYRTDPALVVQAAWPYLEWGQRHRRTVLIALESGPLPDVEARRYAPAGRGELWLTRIGGRTAYVLFDQPVKMKVGERAFAHSGAHLVPARWTTFFAHGDDLMGTVSRLQQAFASTRAFAGVALHGLDHAWY